MTKIQQKMKKWLFGKNTLNCAKLPNFIKFNEIEARKMTENDFFLVHLYSLVESRPQFLFLLYSIQISYFSKSRTTLHNMPREEMPSCADSH